MSCGSFRRGLAHTPSQRSMEISMVVSPRKIFEIQVLTILFWWFFGNLDNIPYIEDEHGWTSNFFGSYPWGSLLLSSLEISFQLMATAFFPHLGTDNFDIIDQHQSSQDFEKNVLTWLLWETLLSVVRLWAGRVLLLSFVASIVPARGPRYQTAEHPSSSLAPLIRSTGTCSP